MNGQDVQEKHHLALLQLRCQDRIVKSDNFLVAWGSANTEQRKVCHKLLRKLKVDELKEWISEILFSDLSAQRIASLRQLASNNRVKGYCNMSKGELLETLISRSIYGTPKQSS